MTSNDATCHHCGKVYSRLEHLRRHQTTHSQEPPWTCDLCGQGYHRSDVLRRHRMSCKPKLYQAKTRIFAPRARKRACTRCSVHKRRCDLQLPCQNCRRVGESCVFPIVDSCSPSFPRRCSSVTERLRRSSISEDSQRRAGPARSAISVTEDDHVDADNVSPDDGIPQYASYDTSSSDITLTFFDFGRVSAWFSDPAKDFDFLLHFIDDNGLSHVFQSDEVIQTLRHHVGLGFIDAATKSMIRNELPDYWDLDFHLAETNSIQLDDLYCDVVDCYYDTIDLNDQPLLVHTPNLHNSHALALWPSEPLLQQTAAIVAGLSQTTALRYPSARTNAISLSQTEEQCRHFFAPANLRRFLTLYFEVWHPNWPAIHKPTFDPLTAPPALVAAMSILGACHSPNLEDRERARTWFDSVEEFVFGELGSGPSPHPPDPASKRHTIQHLQAAYAVCLQQNWDGSRAARWRIRNQRFPTIVAVTRTLDISSAKHADYLHASSTANDRAFDWNAFVEREETIRTILWIYLLDTAFVIFHQMPPRMLLREMHCGLAFPEMCFQAESAQECREEITRWSSRLGRYDRPTSFYALVRMYCETEMDPSLQMALANEAFMNHWGVIGALHVLLFNTEASIASIEQFRPIETGLENWKAVWNHIALCGGVDFQNAPSPFSLSQDSGSGAGTGGGELWKRPGFWRHASEYWLLLRVMLDRIVSAKKSVAGMKEVVGEEHWLVGVEPHLASNAGSTSTGNGEGEMVHLKELIEGFRKLKVGGV